MTRKNLSPNFQNRLDNQIFQMHEKEDLVEKLNNIVIKKSETKNEGRLMDYADVVKKVNSELISDTKMIFEESKTNTGIQDRPKDKVEVKCEEQKEFNCKDDKKD